MFIIEIGGKLAFHEFTEVIVIHTIVTELGNNDTLVQHSPFNNTRPTDKRIRMILKLWIVDKQNSNQGDHSKRDTKYWSFT